MAKNSIVYKCNNCGYEYSKLLGKCPKCNKFGTMNPVEKIDSSKMKMSISSHSHSKFTPKPISEISDRSLFRLETGIGELDSVFGGGIVNDSVNLMCGEPGIGKSTLLIQMAKKISEKYGLVIYITGEESEYQVRDRAKRLGIDSNNNLLIWQEDNMEEIESFIKKSNPVLVIIDSIQTVYSNELASAKGTSTQVRYCNDKLIKLAKSREKATSVIVVGHIVKNGNIAGPKDLEHDVDGVFEFEGDKLNEFRLVRSKKNRFGSTNEIGVFEMTSTGMKEVINPSSLFIDNQTKDCSGCAVSCVMEGNRPILVEIQALVCNSTYGQARRMANGFDYNRLNLIAAILEKKCNLCLMDKDIYLNIVGGIKVLDRASDLAIAMAIISSYYDVSAFENTVYMSELGLTGELRHISRIEQRIKQVIKSGFTGAIIPKSNINNENTLKYNKKEFECFEFKNISDIYKKLKLCATKDK